MMSQASNPEVRRLCTPEVEALKLWAFAVTLALMAGGIYIVGVGVVSALTEQ